MDIDLSFSVLSFRGLAPASLYVDPSDNIQVSITPYGVGVSGSGTIQASLSPGASGTIQVSIEDLPAEPPVLPLAVHIAQGTVLFTWTHPNPQRIQYWELYAATALAGPYTRYHRGKFTSTRGMVNNIPVGITAYFQLRSVAKNRNVSAFVQVKRGKLLPATGTFRMRGINGSQIPEDSIFTSLDKGTGQVVAIKAPSLLTIS